MRLFLFAHAGDDGRLLSIASLAAAAAATGREVTVAWEGPALRRLAAGDLDPPGDDEAAPGVPHPAALLRDARRLGARFVVCPTQVTAAGVDEAAVRARVDAVSGLTALLDAMDGAVVLHV